MEKYINDWGTLRASSMIWTCVFTSSKYKHRFESSIDDCQWKILFENKSILLVVGHLENYYSLINDFELITESIMLSFPETEIMENRVKLLKILMEYIISNANHNYGFSRMFEMKTQKIYEEMDYLLVSLGKMEPVEIKRKCNSLFEFDNMNEHEIALLRFTIYFEFLRVCKRKTKYVGSDYYLVSKRIMLNKAYTIETNTEWKKYLIDFLVYLNEIIRTEESAGSFIMDSVCYVNENYMKNINMTMVANEYDVNYAYYSQKFKEYTGESFNSFLKNLRIKKAKNLLENSCYSIDEIARNSGFNDVKYFFKTFKKMTGITPGEYKRKYFIPG